MCSFTEGDAKGLERGVSGGKIKVAEFFLLITCKNHSIPSERYSEDLVQDINEKIYKISLFQQCLLTQLTYEPLILIF